ncbi:MAG: hypothetical protein HY692_07575 [Cyanobacteria bacterium NC_groundwater_1444_Ag_S-0.65um_54_12]|nr:hypothetical protein [Cyanobacteria bacterium NC_groundwater_1444_Ag_S-0.65um_54_12]
MILLAAFLLGTGAFPTYRIGALEFAIRNGGIVEQAPKIIKVWANSPQIRVAVANNAPGFYNGMLQWRNVPAGSYLVSSRGVAEAATLTAGNLVARLSLPGGGRSSWRLESTIPKDYHFAIAYTAEAYRKFLPQQENSKLRFAIELGGTTIFSAMEIVSSLPFPTYLLPSFRDEAKLAQRYLGGRYFALATGPDRLLLLDNRGYKLDSEQMQWVEQQLRDFRLAGVRRIIVFMQRSPELRRRAHNSIAKRQEVRRLSKLLRKARITAIFAGGAERPASKNWQGIPLYLLDRREVIVADIKDTGFKISCCGKNKER